MVVQVVALDFGDALEKKRIRRIPRVETAQQVERARRLMFVPEIQPVELVVGFAPEDRAAISRLQDLPQSLFAIAARQQQEPAQRPDRRRRDGRVVVIQPDAEVRIEHGRIERDRFFEGVLDLQSFAGG